MRVTHFSDPACPFAFSAEPQRLQLLWHYGDQLEWQTVLVGLSNSAQEMEAKGFDTAKMAAGYARLQEQYGMPIDATERERLTASMPACRAVVATRVHAPERADALLRALRVRNFAGQLLDEPATIDGAAQDAGVDPGDLHGWLEAPATEMALEADLRAARTPHESALALDHKLADAGAGGGRRYTCPSYEFTSGDRTLAAPGMQPWQTYDVLVANAGASVTRRDAPADIDALRGFFDHPLATAEVAALRGIDLDAARDELTAANVPFEPVGADGYWTL
ncbi:MAG: hypothetical protein JWO69_708 [Thermoleophilia bacterium]|jgi:predicted DsbA family dithiol-disulfide isomerase|nr:hypothetical protein [Thermoleophilia bacterium]